MKKVIIAILLSLFGIGAFIFWIYIYKLEDGESLAHTIRYLILPAIFCILYPIELFIKKRKKRTKPVKSKKFCIKKYRISFVAENSWKQEKTKEHDMLLAYQDTIALINIYTESELPPADQIILLFSHLNERLFCDKTNFELIEGAAVEQIENKYVIHGLYSAEYHETKYYFDTNLIYFPNAKSAAFTAIVGPPSQILNNKSKYKDIITTMQMKASK